MSRGFVRESDQEPAPFVPPRAPLPAGSPNYVTPPGLAALRAELDELLAEKRALALADEDQQRRALVVLNARLAALNERIAVARLVDPAKQPRDEVRFGAWVRVSGLPKGERLFRIVGVDEANVREGKIAWDSPLARALTGLWVGEQTKLSMGGSQRKLSVEEISYGE